MENFELWLPTRMICGKSAENRVGDCVNDCFRSRGEEPGKVLLVYGGGSIVRSGLYDRVTVALTVAGLDYVELSGVHPNPALSKVREGIDLARREDVKFILAVGGGSVIDTAKAVALGVPYGGDVWDFYAKKATAKAALPVGVVLTIPAAGSEGSGNSVITNEETQTKVGVRYPMLLRPAFSILNPELCRTLPKEQMAYGACDMFCHIIERYFSHTEHTEITDALCEATFRTIVANARRLYDNPVDYDAWAEILWCGTIAHNGSLSVGRVEDWGSHALEHQLSAAFPKLAHGAGLAAIAPAWLKHARKLNPKRFTDFAVKVFGVDPAGKNADEVALAGIAAFEGFLHDIGLSTHLRDLGVDEAELPRLAANIGRIGPGNFLKQTEEDAMAVYKLAW